MRDLHVTKKIKACATVERQRFKLKHNLFRMEYAGTKCVMTVDQAANGAWRRESEMIEVVW